jgi:hypothetical protein
MIVKKESYSSHRIQIDNEKYRWKRLRQIQSNIKNLHLNSEEIRQLITGSVTPN